MACGSALASLPGSGARAEGTATAGQGRDAEPGTRGRRQKPRPSGAPGAQRRDRFLRHVVEGRQREAGALSQRNKVYLQLKQYLPKKKKPNGYMFFKVRYVFRNIHETHPCGAFRGRQGRREKGADQCHERNRPPVTTCREGGARGARLRPRGAAFKNKDVRVSPGGWSPRTPLALEVSGDAPRKPPLPLRGPPLCLPRGSRPRGAVRKGPCPWPADPRMVPAMCCPPQLEGCIPHPSDAEGLAGWDPAGVQACVLRVTCREQIEEPVGVSRPQGPAMPEGGPRCPGPRADNGEGAKSPKVRVTYACVVRSADGGPLAPAA